MSMKVYNAFRIKKPEGLWALLWKIQAKAEDNIRESFRQHYWELVSRMDTESEEYLKYKAQVSRDTKEVALRMSLACTTVRNGYKANSAQPYRDTYSLDVAVAVYPYRGQVYIRTFVEPCSVVGKVLGFVREMPEVEDYHYQNQTDPPEEVPPKEWAKRRRVWDGITKDPGGVGRHVTLEVLNPSNFYRMDPAMQVRTEWGLNPPKLPLREEIWAGDLRKLASLKGVVVLARKHRIHAEGHFTVTKKFEGWVVTHNGQKRQYPSLNRAADFVQFTYLPEATKDMIRHTLGEHPHAKE